MKTPGRWPNPLNVDFQIPLKHLHISLIKKNALKPIFFESHSKSAKIFKKRLNFKERALSVSQIIEIVRQRGFEGCKNCPGIWMPCISEQKVGRLGEDQH